MKSVRPRPIDPSSSAIAAGCFVSRTWKLWTRNVRRSTSGARLEPPMPSRTTASSPSSATESANRSSSATRSPMRRGSSSHPSHFASSAPVQSVGSRSQIRSISSSRSGVGKLSALCSHAVEKLGERIGELLHPFELERLDHVVVVDADLPQRVEELVRSRDALEHGVAADLAVILEGANRLLGHRVHGVGA